MKNKNYKKLKFPVIEHIVDKQLLELDISPPVNKKLLKNFYNFFKGK